MKGKKSLISLISNFVLFNNFFIVDISRLLTFNLYLFDKGQQFWFGSDGQKGEPKFLALEELHKASNGFLVNDQIYIGVEFFYISTTENMI